MHLPRCRYSRVLIWLLHSNFYDSVASFHHVYSGGDAYAHLGGSCGVVDESAVDGGDAKELAFGTGNDDVARNFEIS